MGNTQPIKIQQGSVVNHPRFKQSTIKDIESIQVIMKINNDNDYQKWQQNLTQIKNIENQQLYLLPKNYQIKKQSTCGSVYNIKIQYWNYQYILEQQINNRSPQLKHFQEQQMWYLLYALITATYNFSKINKRIGDIRPINIFLNDSGQIKIANTLSWPSQSINYIKTYQDRIITYLSPQQLQQCQLGTCQNVLNPQLSQSFSIGLTLLHSALLKNMQILYDTHLFRFQSKLLQQYLLQLFNIKFLSETNDQITYSNHLKQAIIGLCQINPNERLSTQAIYNWIKPHEKDIIDLKPLRIGRPPIIKQRFKLNIVRPKKHDISPPKNVTLKNNTVPVQQARNIPHQNIYPPSYVHYGHIQQIPPIVTKKIVNQQPMPNYTMRVPHTNYPPKQKFNIQSQTKFSRYYSVDPKQFQAVNHSNILNNRKTSNSIYIPPSNQTLITNNKADIINRIDQQLRRSKQLFP